LRDDDQMSIASDLSDVRDDVFMGYAEEDIKPRVARYKVESEDISDEIDQVVPTRSDNVVANDDESLDVVVLYVD
jgi:hypothetical protein